MPLLSDIPAARFADRGFGPCSLMNVSAKEILGLVLLNKLADGGAAVVSPFAYPV